MAHDDPVAGKTIDADWAYYLDLAGTYTPTLTATTTNPNVGEDGFIDGRWHRNGHRITVWGDTLLDGTGADLGGSSWRVSLPFDANASFHSIGVLNAASDCIGHSKIRSGSTSDDFNSSVLLSNTAEMIFYNDPSASSVGASDLTLPVRLKWTVQYLADSADLPS